MKTKLPHKKPASHKPILADPPNQITTLGELFAASLMKKSVVMPNSRCLKGPLPAAFVINMNGGNLYRMMTTGLFIYVPRSRRYFGRVASEP